MPKVDNWEDWDELEDEIHEKNVREKNTLQKEKKNCSRKKYITEKKKKKLKNVHNFE